MNHYKITAEPGSLLDQMAFLLQEFSKDEAPEGDPPPRFDDVYHQGTADLNGADDAQQARARAVNKTAARVRDHNLIVDRFEKASWLLEKPETTPGVIYNIPRALHGLLDAAFAMKAHLKKYPL